MHKQIPLFKVFMAPEAPKRVKSVLQSGFIGEGPEVKRFESELSNYFNIKNYEISTTNSATSAEHLLYHYFKKDRVLVENIFEGVAFVTNPWKSMEGGTVLTTSLTCTATNFPIINNGLKIKWVDVDPITCNMCLDDLQRKIDKDTRLITLVHWGGTPIDLDKLETIIENAEKKYGHKIIVIEDCAHAMGSTYKGTPVGFTGNISTFSLQAIKHITSIDGGFIASPYASLNRDVRLLRWYGINRDDNRKDFRCEADVKEAGFKFHMNDVSAAVGSSNFKYIDKIVGVNKDNGEFYNERLKDIPGITTIPLIPNTSSAYWIYTFHAEDRDGLMKKLFENNVYCSRVHERNDKHSCLSEFQSELPNVDAAVKSMLCIPVGHWVDNEDRERIVDTIAQGW